LVAPRRRRVRVIRRRTMHAALLLLLLHQAHAQFVATQPIVTTLLTHAASLPPHSIISVLDVGANDGRWAESMMRRLTAAAPHLDVQLTIIEPQPRFHGTLRNVAGRWNGTFLPYAAWTRGGQKLTFYRSKLSEAASLYSSTSRAYGALPSITVPTLELPRLVSRITANAERMIASRGLRANESAVLFMKLDVEGAEYDLLPALLTRGSLCALHYAYIEFHLNALDPARRLAGLAMSLGLRQTLLSGCPRPPLAVELFSNRENNQGLPVPGLDIEAARHNASRPNHMTRGWLEAYGMHQSGAGRVAGAAPIASSSPRAASLVGLGPLVGSNHTQPACKDVRLIRTCEYKRANGQCQGSWGCDRTCFGCRRPIGSQHHSLKLNPSRSTSIVQEPKKHARAHVPARAPPPPSLWATVFG